ncbi:MAG: N-formylglutamate amidohydrolase [Erythrobacter sp.]
MAGSDDESPQMREEHGGFVPGCDNQPAFTLRAPLSSPLPVLIAVPHAGRAYPASLLARMRDASFATVRLEDRLVDKVAEEVARLSGAAVIVAHAPRAMLDLNRARDDIDWEMISGQRPHPVRHSQANRRARSGLGLVPRRLPGFGEVWRGLIPREELDHRIAQVHRPYHAAIARELSAIRDRWGAALLLDLHSMPPLRCQPGEAEAPQFVLGDRFGTSCDADLVGRSYRFLETKGKPVAHNRPYAGGFVLDAHSAPARGLHALQLEVCRSTYLDARLAEPTPRMAVLARLLAGMVRELGEAVAEMGRGAQLPQAAE